MAITKLLIANRGEISCRAQKACADLSLPCVAVFTEPDAMSLHVLNAQESVCLGKSPKEYLNADRILEVCKETGADAVFPGYGFLSENAEFSERCEAAGIAFIGPTGETMRQFSQKHTARELAEKAGVPVLPGTSLLTSGEEALEAAKTIGLPVLLKATGGGGGIGIHMCRTEEEVAQNFASAARQGAAAFGDAGVFVEKYVEHARHIEIQIFGDGQGTIVTFPERECSIQRRHQKVLEETPSPFVSARPEIRAALRDAASRLGSAIKYRSAGTVEFILDDETGLFYFLEVNTRLQVEHGITEMVSGVDLVCWQFQLQGAPRPAGIDARAVLPTDLAAIDIEPTGHAIEVRVCAEDPANDYRPCTGTLGEVAWPQNARVDTWVETGSEVPAYYDSLLAKVMVHCPEGREASTVAMISALDSTYLRGVTTNLELLREIVAAKKYAAGATTTKFLEGFPYVAHSIQVVEPGLMTTVQDYPGRVAKWAVGVPPSGPMDDLSHRLANAIVGNADNAAALEVTLSGPTLKFLAPGVVAVCGAEAPVTVDGVAVPQWQSFKVEAGQLVKVGATSGGSRTYIAIAGGVDVPEYLGSKSTFPGAVMGGHQGRALRAGDMLPMGLTKTPAAVGAQVPIAWRPVAPAADAPWEVAVLPGPQADPDYFTREDVKTFFSTTFKVHHNSNRLGIRLDGPRPQFAREGGGEGGSHPSNVLDHVYAIGTINYTGDMPVVLTVDGPSLGGFACPATILTTEQWKMGQVRPGDGIIFKATTIEAGVAARLGTDKLVQLVCSVGRGEMSGADAEGALGGFAPQLPPCPPTQAILWEMPAEGSHPGAILRLAGDRYVFLEWGPMELDLNLRVRVQQFEDWLAAAAVSGVIETSPGVRSVMIEYDQRVLPLTDLIELIKRAEAEMVPSAEVKMPVRIVHLPMAFDDKWNKEAISRYTRSVRPEAPYLPSNIEFIAKNNGLQGDPLDAVHKVVFDASYMVMGLGDVYLGAPCAVPVDPRHRLVVPKYNPARTFTPEGAVGIGGVFMCIYGMDSPGGYQLIGRTLPIWNSFTRAGPFEKNKPWLLRNFDQVRYYEVSEDELEQLRTDFKNGRLDLKIENDVLDMTKYNAMIEETKEEVAVMRATQAAAMAEQMAIDVEQLARIDSKASLPVSSSMASMGGEGGDDPYIGRDGEAVRAAVTGTVWEVKAEIGQQVAVGDTLLVLEAMKMEYAVVATSAGKVVDIAVGSGDMVQQGASLCLVE